MADDDGDQGNGEQHDHDDDGGDIPPETESRIVDKVVAKVKDVLAEITGPAGGGEKAAVPAASAPAGPAATEADMERQVKEGVEKEITARERRTAREEARRAHDEDHERLRALVETPPKAYSRLTRAVWGNDDGS